jgi:uncharacterized C2H2 Zn-finger protein
MIFRKSGYNEITSYQEMRMKVPKEPTRQDYIRSIVYIGIYVIIIGVGAWLLLPVYWYVWGALVLGGLVWLVNWHRSETVYRCPNCEQTYEISFFTDLLAPHGVDREGGWLLLRCPNCGQRQKTRVLKRADH